MEPTPSNKDIYLGLKQDKEKGEFVLTATFDGDHQDKPDAKITFWCGPADIQHQLLDYLTKSAYDILSRMVEERESKKDS